MNITRSPNHRPSLLRVSSSDQLASILYQSSPLAKVTPVSPVIPMKRTPFTDKTPDNANIASNTRTVLRKPQGFGGNCSNGLNKSKNLGVPSKPLAEIEVNNAAETNSTVPSNKMFCRIFSGWLQKVEQQYDSERFDRLKDDLRRLVGKYALEAHQDE